MAIGTKMAGIRISRESHKSRESAVSQLKASLSTQSSLTKTEPALLLLFASQPRRLVFRVQKPLSACEPLTHISFRISKDYSVSRWLPILSRSSRPCGVWGTSWRNPHLES